MKYRRVFCLLSLVLCANICPLFAKAPRVPKILFTSARDGNYEVYIMNPNGSEQVNLTQHHAQDLEAIWSPTGEQILFVSDRGGRRDLYVMHPDGSNVRRSFRFKIEANRIAPTWSPDGKQIAYVQRKNRSSTIYIATLETQQAKPFVTGSDPAWSPNSTEIACIIAGRLTFINIETGQQKHLLPKKAMFWQNHPSWSAAGDKLVFSWNKNQLPPAHKLGIEPVPRAWVQKETVYIVNRDGTGIQQLVDEAGPYTQYPALSPNGNEVLYTQEVKGFLQIFKVDVKSGVRTQLTHTESRNLGGDWFDPAFALRVSPQPQLLTTTWGKIKKASGP